MPLFATSLLSTAYLPPVEYFFAAANSGKVLLEQCESYCKQSYRNRCNILSASGPEALSVPVVKVERDCRAVRDVRIDYDGQWLLRHKRALEAAYNSSAFFEYYRDDIFRVLDSRPKFLFDLNLELFETLLNLLEIKVSIELTQEYETQRSDAADLRNRIHPKWKGSNLMEEYGFRRPWFQVFGEKGRQSFVPNLSVIDLLSAEGPDALSYLVRI